MSIFGLFERRTSLESPTLPLTSTALLDWLGGTLMDSGIQVSETSSLATSAVWRATALISSLGGALPLPTYTRGTQQRAELQPFDDWHPEMPGLELKKMSYVHRCLWGNSYYQKVRSRSGELKYLYPITPDRCAVGRVRPSTANPAGKMFRVVDDWGEAHAFTTRDILHVPGLGYDGLTGCSPVRAAAQGVGLALAAEKSAAKLFGSGNMLSGFLQTEQRLSQPQAEALQARWREKMSGASSAHEVGVLDSGAKFESLTMPNDDAQMLESRQFQVTDLARYFGVPPFLMMQTEKSTSWGTGLEQQSTGFSVWDLHPQWLAPYEARINKELLFPLGLYCEYNMEGLLRGDSKSRAEFYRVMREIGAFSANDVRELENRPPIEGGESYLQPLNMVPLGSAPDDDQDEPPDDPDDDAED